MINKDNTTKTIVVILDKDLRFICGNEMFFKFSKYPPKDILYKPVFEIFKNFKSELPFDFWDAPLSLVSFTQEKYPVYGAVHTLFPEMQMAKNNWVLIGKIANDIRNSKISEKCLACSGIIHDMRNVMTAIHSFISLLDLKSKKENNFSNGTNIVCQALDRMKNLIMELERIIKKEERILTKCCLNEVINSSLYLAVKQNNYIKTTISLPDENIYINGNKEELFRAFYNLFINSCHAMNGEGRIDVEIKLINEKKESIDNILENKIVKIKITDSGPGIDSKIIESIFLPFTSTKGKERGLGLYIVKDIIEKHKGEISVIQSQEKGAVFLITLPCL